MQTSQLIQKKTCNFYINTQQLILSKSLIPPVFFHNPSPPSLPGKSPKKIPFKTSLKTSPVNQRLTSLKLPGLQRTLMIFIPWQNSTRSLGEYLHPRKLTWHLKMYPWKRMFVLETIIFRGYVSFRGSTPLKNDHMTIAGKSPRIFNRKYIHLHSNGGFSS